MTAPQSPDGAVTTPAPSARKPSRARRDRGMQTQKLVADWFAVSGWPYAESTGSGRAGVDVTGLPGLSCEVKATTRESVTGALRQAQRNAGDGLPFVVYRPNGHGPTSIAEWPVIVPLGAFTTLLAQAGYGTGRLS